MALLDQMRGQHLKLLASTLAPSALKKREHSDPMHGTLPRLRCTARPHGTGELSSVMCTSIAPRGSRSAFPRFRLLRQPQSSRTTPASAEHERADAEPGTRTTVRMHTIATLPQLEAGGMCRTDPSTSALVRSPCRGIGAGTRRTCTRTLYPLRWPPHGGGLRQQRAVRPRLRLALRALPARASPRPART